MPTQLTPFKDFDHVGLLGLSILTVPLFVPARHSVTGDLEQPGCTWYETKEGRGAYEGKVEHFRCDLDYFVFSNAKIFLGSQSIQLSFEDLSVSVFLKGNFWTSW